MTEPQAAPTAPKKKMSPLAWIAIGCAGLIVVAGILFVVGGAFVFHKAKQKLGDFEKNPAMAAAEMVVRANPDLELVSSDPDAGTLTVRDKKTGEETTVDLDQIKEGKISFQSGDQGGTVAFGGAGNEGSMTVTDKDGKATFKAGAGSADEIPDWVPIYGGATPAGTYRMTSGGETTGAFSLTTSDAPQEVLDFYGRAADGLGGEVQRHTFSAGGRQGGIVSGGTKDGSRKLAATVTNEGGTTTVAVTYSEKS